MEIIGANQLNIRTQSLSVLNTLDLLSLLNVGDSIRAMVLEIKGDNALLEFAGNNVFTASIKGDINLSKGSMVTLFVQSIEEGQIVMQPVNACVKNSFQDTLIRNMAYEQLEKNDIPANNKNLQIAVELLKSGNTPDKAAISVISTATESHEELDIKSAVFLLTKNMSFEQKNISALKQFDEGLFQLGKGIFTLASDKRMSDLPELKSFVEFTRDLFLKPEQIRDLLNTGESKVPGSVKETKINELFKELYLRLETVKNTLNSLPGRDYDSLAGSADKYMQGIKFLIELNREFTYVQIPVALNEYRTQGELFVLKRKRTKGKINPENATILLSLDTESIGHVDTLLSISSKDIRLHIKTFEKDTLDFLRKNNSLLFKMLSGKGYRVVDIQYGIVKERISLLDFEDILNEFLKNEKQSIDLLV